MKKKYVLLVLIIVLSITLIVSFNNKTINKLDEVKLNEKESEMFAIMLQNDTGYEESSNNEWPDYKYKFNEELSGCIDKNGEKIKEEILTFDEETRKATVETSKTSYCYLYFDKLTAPGTKLEGYSNLSYDLKGGMYRYQGTSDVVDNNYICFGTTNKQDCINNQDAYMYRIIGIVGKDCTPGDDRDCDDTVSKDMIKVIKKTALKEKNINTFQWHMGYNGDQYADILWSSSSLKQRLNGESSGQTKGSKGNTNIFLNSDNSLYSYMKDSTWTNKIVNKNWYEGDIGGEVKLIDPLEIFNKEYGISETTFYRGEGELKTAKWTKSNNKFKICIINLSDYYWSVSSNGVICNDNNKTICKSSWLHISKGGAYYEWAMDRIGRYNSIIADYYATNIHVDGDVKGGFMTTELSARPVFYLNSNITLTGTGIMNDNIQDPFMITN